MARFETDEHGITSEYPTRRATDLTFRFVGGTGVTVRLYDGIDDYEIERDSILLTIKNANGDGSEQQFIERRNLLFFAIKTGIIETVYPPGASPAEKRAAELDLEMARRESERSHERLNRRLDKFAAADPRL